MGVISSILIIILFFHLYVDHTRSLIRTKSIILINYSYTCDFIYNTVYSLVPKDSFNPKFKGLVHPAPWIVLDTWEYLYIVLQFPSFSLSPQSLFVNSMLPNSPWGINTAPFPRDENICGTSSLEISRALFQFLFFCCVLLVHWT